MPVVVVVVVDQPLAIFLCERHYVTMLMLNAQYGFERGKTISIELILKENNYSSSI